MYYQTHPDTEIEATKYHLADLRREGARARRLKAILGRSGRGGENAPKPVFGADPNHAAAATA